MATKRLGYDGADDIEDGDYIEGTARDETEITQTVEEELNSILEEIDADKSDIKYRVKIYRVVQGNQVWLFDAAPREYFLPTLRDEYGGGTFLVVVYKENRIFKKKRLMIEAKPKKVEDRPAPTTQENGAMFEVMRQMQEANRELLGQIATAVSQRPDPMASMMQAVAMMAQIKEVMGFGGGQNAVDPMKQFRDSISIAREMMEMAGGGGGHDTSDVLMKAIESFAPMIAKATEKELDAMPSKTPALSSPTPFRPIAGPQSLPVKPAAPQPPVGGPEMLIQMALKKNMPMLMDKAAKGKDPGLYAEVVLDNIPESFFPQFVRFIAQPDALDKMIAAYPPAAQYREWFAQLREAILADGEESEEEEGSEDEIPAGPLTQTGNEVNTPKHADIDPDDEPA